ncbi:MAG: cellulose synthase catalytic subunit [Pseudomonadota bacterium]
MSFYFERFEDRQPKDPLPYSPVRESIYQLLAVINLTVGAWYIHWRWTESLNWDALWFAIPMAVAETGAYIGLVLFTVNLWNSRDVEQKPPPESISDCDPRVPERPITVDVFFPTYDEDPDLVRLSLLDAKRIRYPHRIETTIHVLDDGKRPEMKAVADEEGVNYITRDSNIGFKAGNLRNAMEVTFGDFIVICDADTRPFPTILERTLGYFRDPDVAWVQTPQWFFDLPEGKPLPDTLGRYLGGFGRAIGRGVERVIGPVKVGEDPFVNDPQMFYDVIQRRRNWAHASFCCGAGSIHRREAVMEAALKTFGAGVDREVSNVTDEIEDDALKDGLDSMMRREAVLDTELTPYKFHVSEDIYTSIVLHSDPDREWKSVMHPHVESKMLSPQDLQTWVVQRFKYAGGTIDIAVHDFPLKNPGMSFKRKLLYGATIWSYFGCLWNMVFLFAPIVYLFSGIAPVSSYSLDFFKHILPFIITTELAMMVGTWGLSGFKGRSSYLSFFPINLRAIWTVLKGEQIKFPATPKDRQEGNFFHLVLPQFSVILLTVAGIIFASVKFMHTQDLNLLAGLMTNIFWGINNIVAMSGLVLAAFWRPDDEPEEAAEFSGVQATQI